MCYIYVNVSNAIVYIYSFRFSNFSDVRAINNPSEHSALYREHWERIVCASHINAELMLLSVFIVCIYIYI